MLLSLQLLDEQTLKIRSLDVVSERSNILNDIFILSSLEGVDEAEAYAESSRKIIKALTDILFYCNIFNKEIFIENKDSGLYTYITLNQLIKLLQDEILSGQTELTDSLCDKLESLKEIMLNNSLMKFLIEIWSGSSEEMIAARARIELSICNLRAELLSCEALETVISIDYKIALNDYMAMAEQCLVDVNYNNLDLNLLSELPLSVVELILLHSNKNDNELRLVLYKQVASLNNYSGLISELEEERKNIFLQECKQIVAAFFLLKICLFGRGYLHTSEVVDDVDSAIKATVNILNGSNDCILDDFYIKILRCYRCVKSIIDNDVFTKTTEVEKTNVIIREQMKKLEVMSVDLEMPWKDFAVKLQHNIARNYRGRTRRANIFSKRVFHDNRHKDPRKVNYIHQANNNMELDDEDWRSSRDLIEEVAAEKSVDVTMVNYKIRRKYYLDGRYHNSFMFNDGKAYAMSRGEQCVLGTGRISKVKMLQREDGENYALKRESDTSALGQFLVTQEREILRIQGKLIGHLSREDVGKEYTIIPLELGANLLEGFIFTGIVARYNLSFDVAIKCLEEVSNAHELRIIHRDLKPQNFMMWIDSGNIHIKLIDYGLAAVLAVGQVKGVSIDSLDSENSAEDGEIRGYYGGTMGYMSDESGMRGEYSIKSDIFAMGCLLDGSLGIYIPEMTSEMPDDRPPISEVITYLKMRQSTGENISLTEWKAAPYIEVPEYAATRDLDFTVMYDNAIEDYEAYKMEKEDADSRVVAWLETDHSDEDVALGALPIQLRLGI
ncbi:MAG: protein kinase family protein [Francisellaceae bacterium]|jgi:serine/threonine protein kinase|nr:protein kinase family protein [Francisellaceae bacterium]MBT6207980.1 protein kinase family protein [Francisellaceae bacterium]MBT6538477.1 protein kinase family protein [Francisellaceae bacterium]